MVFGKFVERSSKSRQHFSGMVYVEQIDRGGILSFEEANFQLPHESGRRHPEIVPYHHDALHVLAVTLPQGLHQVGVLLFLFGVQPLFELVQDDQHLLMNVVALPRRSREKRLVA